MTTPIIRLVLILSLATLSIAAARDNSLPRPIYPYAARVKGITGSGVVLLVVDTTTGKVRGARMLKSTGNKLLDGAALEAFSRWRFKPGTPAEVKVPIHFTLAHKR